MSNPILDKISEQFDGMLEDNAALRSKVEEMEKQVLGAKKIGRDQAEAEGKINRLEQMLKLQDETIKSQQEHLDKVETEFKNKRFGLTGTDSLLEVIPDDHRKWIETVKGRSGDDPLARVTDNDPIKRIAIGSWFHSAIRSKIAAHHGNSVDATRYHERMEKLSQALGGVQKDSGGPSLQEDTAIEGGNLVPTIVESVLGRIIYDNGVLRQSGPTVIQMTAKTHNLPTLDNNFDVYIVSEEGTVTSAMPTTAFGSAVLTARKFAGMATVSMELLEDNVVNLSDFLLTHLGEMIARKEDTEFLQGTSVAGFTGGLGTNTSVNTILNGGASATIASELVFKSLVDAIYKGAEAHTRQNAKWWMHPYMCGKIIQLTTANSGTSGGTSSPWFSFAWNNSTLGATLLGYQLLESSTVATTSGTTSDESYLYFGNARGFVVGDRAGTRFDIDPYGLFASAQVRVRILKRTGLLCWVPKMFTKIRAAKTPT